MSDYAIRRATEEDVLTMAEQMRAVDRAEADALGIDDVVGTLLASIDAGSEAFVLHAGDDLVALWGVSPHDADPETGIPWMIATDAIYEHREHVMRVALEWVQKTAQRFGRLSNVVFAQHGAAVRFLTRLGFEVGPVEWRGPHGDLFFVFSMAGGL